MLNMSKATMESLLCGLEENGYLFLQYKFYKVDQQLQMLGRGGFSVIYDVVDKDRTDRHYALKVIGLERHTVTSKAFRETTRYQRILCEQSPYVLRILETRELLVTLDEEGNLLQAEDVSDEGQNEEKILLQFILMERLEQILEKDKFKHTTLVREELQSETEVLKFARQIGQAIMKAHKNHILHRDIKLENIFWDEREDCYKLGDFGIAKYVENGSAETIVYTDGYGAPEIERRLRRNYNATADIYSFGISLYLLLNDLKFPGSQGYYVNMVQYEPDFILPAPAHASPELARIIRKMCSYRKEDRYQSMSEVLADLNGISSRAGQTDDEAELDLADLETETYREEKQEREDDDESSAIRRSRRKEEQKLREKYYNSWNMKYILTFFVLFMLLAEGMQWDVSMLKDWHFWILPIVVFFEAVFLMMKEFHILFGIATIAFAIYSALVSGVTVIHVLLLACVVTGIPGLVAAGAAGTGFWMILQLTGRMSWLGFVEEYDLSWIVLALILIVADRYIFFRAASNRTTFWSRTVWNFCGDKIGFFMVIAGAVLGALEHFKGLRIPDIVQEIHLIRIGILICVVNAVDYWHAIRKLDDEDGVEVAENNVYMGERRN